MKNVNSKLTIFTVALMLVVTAANSSPFTTTNKDFDVSSTYGDRNTFEFPVTESGCIIAQVQPWSSSKPGDKTASKLALILNGSDRTEYYARTDGSATSIVPLWMSYSVSSTQIGKVRTWTISVVNFTKSGTAKGKIYWVYPPTQTPQTPCELKVTVSKTKGQLDLNWLYTGKSFKGSFLIERSTDGKKWDIVSACTKSAPTSKVESTSYSCSDTKLRGSITYYYRACAITTGSICDTKQNITPAIGVKIP